MKANHHWAKRAVFLCIIALVATVDFDELLGMESSKETVDKPKRKAKSQVYGAVFLPGQPYCFDVHISKADIRRGYVRVCTFQAKALVRDGDKGKPYVASVSGVCRANEDGTCPPATKAISTTDFKNFKLAKVKGHDLVSMPKKRTDHNIRSELENHIWVELFIDKRTGKRIRVRSDQPNESSRYLK